MERERERFFIRTDDLYSTVSRGNNTAILIKTADPALLGAKLGLLSWEVTGKLGLRSPQKVYRLVVHWPKVHICF